MAPVHRELIERVGGGAPGRCSSTPPSASRRTPTSWSPRPRSTSSAASGTPSSWPACAVSRPPPRWSGRPPTAASTTADYVFSGPGSPSYTLRQWRGTEIPRLLREAGAGWLRHPRLGRRDHPRGGSLPVYEIYKVGEPVHWLEGLDLMSAAGIRAALPAPWERPRTTRTIWEESKRGGFIPNTSRKRSQRRDSECAAAEPPPSDHHRCCGGARAGCRRNLVAIHLHRGHGRRAGQRPSDSGQLAHRRPVARYTSKRTRWSTPAT